MSEKYDLGSSTPSINGFSESGLVPQTAMQKLQSKDLSANESSDSVYQTKQAKSVLRVSRGGASESRNRRMRSSRNNVLMVGKQQ